jgi:hypothetical protein
VSRLGMRPVGTWGSPRQPLMAPAERLGQWNGRRARMPCGAHFIEVARPLCDAREERGEGDGTCAGMQDGDRRSAQAGIGALACARSDTRRARLPRCSGRVRPRGAGPWGERRPQEGVRGP